MHKLPLRDPGLLVTEHFILFSRVLLDINIECNHGNMGIGSTLSKELNICTSVHILYIWQNSTILLKNNVYNRKTYCTI